MYDFCGIWARILIVRTSSIANNHYTKEIRSEATETKNSFSEKINAEMSNNRSKMSRKFSTRVPITAFYKFGGWFWANKEPFFEKFHFLDRNIGFVLVFPLVNVLFQSAENFKQSIWYDKNCLGQNESFKNQNQLLHFCSVWKG